MLATRCPATQPAAQPQWLHVGPAKRRPNATLAGMSCGFASLAACTWQQARLADVLPARKPAEALPMCTGSAAAAFPAGSSHTLTQPATASSTNACLHPSAYLHPVACTFTTPHCLCSPPVPCLPQNSVAPHACPNLALTFHFCHAISSCVALLCARVRPPMSPPALLSMQCLP